MTQPKIPVRTPVKRVSVGKRYLVCRGVVAGLYVSWEYMTALERKDDQVRFRDYLGSEAWYPIASVYREKWVVKR